MESIVFAMRRSIERDLDRQAQTRGRLVVQTFLRFLLLHTRAAQIRMSLNEVV